MYGAAADPAWLGWTGPAAGARARGAAAAARPGRPAPGRATDSAHDDVALATRVLDGDATAFDELVRRHMRRAYAVAYRVLRHPQDAEDLVQDAFLLALRKIDTLERGRPFAPWF